MAPLFRLRTLGGLALERLGDVSGEAARDTAAQRKTLALLALLAASRQLGVSRDRLLALLWPESDAERARGALNQALHVVRRLVGPDALLGGAELRLNPAVIASDVDGLLSDLERGDAAHAAQRYAGPFLAGFHLTGAPEFLRWQESTREELARRHATAVEQLARRAGARGDHHEAIAWWRRLQAEDPLSARTTLGLMEALAAAGHRAAAIRCAQAHEAMLREELDSDPDPDVSTLAAELREAEKNPQRVRLPGPGASDLPGRVLPHATQSANAPRGGRGPAAPETPPRPAPVHPGRRWLVTGLGVGLVAVLALGLAWRVRSDAATPSSDPPAVAVLPFTATAGADGRLAAGLTEEVAIALRGVPGLRVARSEPTTALVARRLPRRALAESLAVATLLDGTASTTNGRLRVSARLVRARDERVLWSASYDRGTGERFELEDEIARAVASALRLPAGAAPRRESGRGTDDLEAYELYLEGRHRWRQRTPAALLDAAKYYESAVDRDPAFARAWAGLAEVYINISNFGLQETRQALINAERAADRALELEPTLADAHAAKGFALTSRMELGAAEATFRRALALNPDHTWAHHYYTLLLMMQGRTGEARERNRIALRTDPLSRPAIATRGIILAQEGDLDGAVVALEEALSRAPDFQLGLAYLGAIRLARGEDAAAIPLLERARATSPDFTGIAAALAVAHQRAGRRQSADSIVRDLRGRATTERVQANLAFTLGALGDVDGAFALMERLRWDVPTMIELRTDPLLAPVRADPRYDRLLERAGVRRSCEVPPC